MKVFKISSLVLLLIFATSSISAMDQKTNWEELRISTSTNNLGNLELLASIEATTNQSDYYSLGVNIGNETYRKFFQYNAQTGMLEVAFTTNISAKSRNIPYFFSIKDVQYNELYTWNSEISLEEEKATVTQSVNSQNNTSPNYIIGGEYNRNSVIPTNVSRPGVTPVIVPEIIEPAVIPQIEETSVISVNEIIPTVQPVPVAPVPETYTPKYNSRAEEPRSINGIGNSPSYKSWRAQK